MSSLSSPEMSGKTCLPCLPHLPQPFGEDMSSPSSPEMLGKTCLPHFPRDVGEDICGMLGKTLGDVGEDRNIGKDTQGYRGGHQGGWV